MLRSDLNLWGQTPAVSFASLTDLTENERFQMYNTRSEPQGGGSLISSDYVKTRYEDKKDPDHMGIPKPTVVRARGCTLRRGNGLNKLIKKAHSILGLYLFSTWAWCEAFSGRSSQSGFLAHRQHQYLWSWAVSLSTGPAVNQEAPMSKGFFLTFFLVAYYLPMLKSEEFLFRPCKKNLKSWAGKAFRSRTSLMENLN